MSHLKHSVLDDPHPNSPNHKLWQGSLLVVSSLLSHAFSLDAAPLTTPQIQEEEALMNHQADALNEQMGQVSVSAPDESQSSSPLPSSLPTTSPDAESDSETEDPTPATTEVSSVPLEPTDEVSPSDAEAPSSPNKPSSPTSASSVLSSALRPCHQKSGTHDYTVAMVGQACVTHSDVVKRMKWTELITQRPIHAKVYDKMYQQTLVTLIQEVRHLQNLLRVRKAIKDGFQSNEAPFLKDAFLHQYTHDMIAKAYPIPVDKLKKMAGDLYGTLYQMWFARIVAMICARVMYGKELTEPHEAAIRSQMKRDQAQTKEVWYRTKDIVVSNHHGHWSVSNNPLTTVREMLEDGIPFSQLASQWSDASANASGEGSWRPLSSFPKAVQSFLTQASIGDISPIVVVPAPNNPQKFLLTLLCDIQQPAHHPRQSAQEKRALAMHTIMEIKMARCHKKMNAFLQKLYPSKVLWSPRKPAKSLSARQTS